MATVRRSLQRLHRHRRPRRLDRPPANRVVHPRCSCTCATWPAREHPPRSVVADHPVPKGTPRRTVVFSAGKTIVEGIGSGRDFVVAVAAVAAVDGDDDVAPTTRISAARLPKDQEPSEAVE